MIRPVGAGWEKLSEAPCHYSVASRLVVVTCECSLLWTWWPPPPPPLLRPSVAAHASAQYSLSSRASDKAPQEPFTRSSSFVVLTLHPADGARQCRDRERSSGARSIRETVTRVGGSWRTFSSAVTTVGDRRTCSHPRWRFDRSAFLFIQSTVRQDSTADSWPMEQDRVKCNARLFGC